MAVEEIKLWPLAQDIQEAEQEIFGVRCMDYAGELKGRLFLKRKTFKLAAQTQPLTGKAPGAERGVGPAHLYGFAGKAPGAERGVGPAHFKGSNSMR